MVFYRGLHCPVCRAQLSELNRRLARQRDRPRVRGFPLRAISDDEPAWFSEPGLFLIRSDGTVYYASVNSMPIGRPRLDDVLSAIDYAAKADYPARGEA